MRNVWLEAMAAALLLLVPATGKGANGAFAYQGLLLNEKGQVLSARNHTIVFRIYDQASGGDPLWTCTRKVFLNEKGLFSVELSGNAVSGQSLDALLLAKASKTLYIGLTVDNDTDEIRLWPFLRRWANVENQTVATSEYTVWETIGPAAAVTGYLMGPGLSPPVAPRTPAADVRDLPGYWSLP